MLTHFKLTKRVCSIVFILTYIFSFIHVAPFAESDYASMSFRAEPMEDNGDVKVYVQINDIKKVMPLGCNGVNNLRFSIAFDEKIYKLKNDKETGFCFYTDNSCSAKQDGLSSGAIDESSFWVSYSGTNGEVIPRNGYMGYFLLTAKQPRKLYNSDDLYPVRFIKGSIYTTTFYKKTNETLRITPIKGIGGMIGGYTPRPVPEIDSELVAAFEAQDDEYAKNNPKTVIPPRAIEMTIDSPKIVLDGITVIMDVAPYINYEVGRTMVPIRFITEEIGFSVDWSEEDEIVTISDGKKTISLKIGGRSAVINGANKEMDVEPVITEDRTLVPVRFITEEFGYNVDWDEDNQKITFLYIISEQNINI